MSIVAEYSTEELVGGGGGGGGELAPNISEGCLVPQHAIVSYSTVTVYVVLNI